MASSSSKMKPMQNLKQQTLLQQQWKADGKMGISTFKFNPEVSRRELACMIIMHEYPLAIVDHEGFRRYSASLQPLFDIPSRNTVKADILKIYEVEKSKIITLVNTNASRIGLTTDMWTASNQKKGYMAITAHFIDNDWKLQSMLMRFIYVPCPHTAITLSKELLKSVYDWNIERKLSTLTVDNCSTNDSLVNILVTKLGSSHLLLRGSLFHMRCCAHILNIIVQDGLKVMGDGIERVRDSVSYWLATPKRIETFRENVRHLGIDSTKQLVLDCKTRWNSTYLMLSVALEYKDVFMRLKERDVLFICAPYDDDWEFAKEICDRLKLFYNASNKFSGTKYPTSNIFFPLMCEIKYALRSWIECRNVIVANMAKSMLMKLDKYWEVVHGLMAVANILDPRYKLDVMEFFFPKIYGDNAQEQMDRVLKYCVDLVREYQKVPQPTNCGQSNFEISAGIESEDDVFFNSGFDTYKGKGNSTRGLKSELDKYLEEENMPRNDPTFNVLVWWQGVGLRYPILRKIARDILAVPISTVASESVFSTGGRVVSPHRSRLHPKTLEALMCSQSWLLKDVKGQVPIWKDAYGSIYDDCGISPDELEDMEIEEDCED